MRSMEPWLPPWLRNQSAKEMRSRLRTACMPPSGSTRARTIGDVPNANELAACHRVVESVSRRTSADDESLFHESLLYRCDYRQPEAGI